MTEIRIGAANDGNKMVFEGLDCTFSRVGLMVSWGGQLVLKLFRFNVGDKFFGDFIVKA